MTSVKKVFRIIKKQLLQSYGVTVMKKKEEKSINITPEELVSLALGKIKEIEKTIAQRKAELARRLSHGARRTSGPYKFPLQR